MAKPPLPSSAPPGQTTVDAFITDRQLFWESFTRFSFRAVLAVAVLVILMAIFLV